MYTFSESSWETLHLSPLVFPKVLHKVSGFSQVKIGTEDTPFSPILFFCMEWMTSSGTVTCPSGVLTGATLTQSHATGTYLPRHCNDQRMNWSTFAALKMLITASDISGPIPSPLMSVTLCTSPLEPVEWCFALSTADPVARRYLRPNIDLASRRERSCPLTFASTWVWLCACRALVRLNCAWENGSLYS